MKKGSRLITITAVLVMAVGGSAGATHTPDGEVFAPEFVETPVYLHCNGPTKLGNVHATVDSARVAFDTTKPAASVTTGAGCGTLDTFVAGTANHNPIYDFPVRGSFTGNIDNITVRFWAVELAASRALNEFTVDLHLVIDGVEILTRAPATLAHAPAQGDPNDPARLYEVTITKVGLDTAADHDMEHEVELTAYSKFANGSGINLWVYDAAEIDSGLIFNDTTPSAVKIPRNG